MNIRPSIALFVFLALGSLGALASARAEVVKMPKEDPVFTMKVPASLTDVSEKDGMYTFATKSGNYAILVLPATKFTTKAEAKAGLKTAITTMAKEFKLKDVEVGDIEDQSGEDGNFFAVRGDGKDPDNLEMALTGHVFEPKKGKWFIILGVGSEKITDAHAKDYQELVESVTAVE